MALVVLAHVPLVLLFLWGWRVRRDETESTLVFIGLWPAMRDEAEATLPHKPQPVAQRIAPRGAARGREPPAPQSENESSAINLPAESTPSAEPPGASVDWRAEGTAAAARQAAPTAPSGFSAPPKVARKACEKPKSSWEWNKEPKKAGITPIPYGVPLPYVVLGRCVVGLGFFGCSLQKPPEANSHLLDDMRDGKTSPSSVPDPDRCD